MVALEIIAVGDGLGVVLPKEPLSSQRHRESRMVQGLAERGAWRYVSVRLLISGASKESNAFSTDILSC